MAAMFYIVKLVQPPIKPDASKTRFCRILHIGKDFAWKTVKERAMCYILPVATVKTYLAVPNMAVGCNFLLLSCH
jgi:hypothetical protein